MTDAEATTTIGAQLAALVARLSPITPGEACRDVVETMASLCTEAAQQGPAYTARLAVMLRAAQEPLWLAMIAGGTRP